MSRLLQQAGIQKQNILIEDESHNTLQSVRNCVRILRSLSGPREIVICSDTYHIPRCRWLFRLYGIRTRPGKVRRGRESNTSWRWGYYYLREVAALPWNTLIALMTRSPR